ncbi:fungal-specific transcription factor domain-containing protein, partial [Aspergillus cavernicola]
MPRGQPNVESPHRSRNDAPLSDEQGPSGRKRRRDDAEEAANPPCAQCRTRKVRCDRQQPECSNCHRAGVTCDYSNSPSRVYHVKDLLDAFSAVTSRLDSMEATLAGLVDHIKRTAPIAPQSPPTTQVPTSAPDTQLGQLEEDEPSASGLDDEPVHGYPAAFALFKSLHCRLARALNGRSEGPRDMWTLAARYPAVRRILKQQLDVFPFNGVCLQFAIPTDGQPIEAPPRSAVEMYVRRYQEDINPYTPVFDKTGVEDAVAFYYDSPPCQQSSAQALTLSNIYLLAMTLEVRVHRGEPTGPQPTYYDLDCARWLLANCDRALEDLEAFSKPSLENLKALLTLALVCQEYHISPVISRVCQAVTRLVRSLGLHQNQVRHTGSWETIPEQERLFWVTFSLDKRLVFLNGHPGDLYLFESTLPLHPCNDQAPTHREFNGAFNHLFTIWEDIYLSLYSLRSTTTHDTDREAQCYRLTGILQEWQEIHKLLVMKPLIDRAYHLKSPQIELRYAFHTTQVLIQRCDTSLSPEERYRNHAQSALELIKTADITIRARIFRNYPMVAFHDLFLYILISDKSGLVENTECADLLRSVRRSLEPFRDPNFPESYYNKLYSGFSWCTDQLDILQNAINSTLALSGGICPNLADFEGFTVDMVPDPERTPTTGVLDGVGHGHSSFPTSESFFDAGLFSSLRTPGE